MKRFLVLVCVLTSAPAWAWGFRTGQVAVTVGTAVIVGSTAQRTQLSMCNLDATNPIYCGDSTVTSSTGLELKPGVNPCFTVSPTGYESNSPAAQTVYCVATGGTVTTYFWENVR